MAKEWGSFTQGMMAGGKFCSVPISYWFSLVSFVLRTSAIGGTAVQVVRRGGGAGEAKTSTVEAANHFPISVTSRELVFDLA